MFNWSLGPAGRRQRRGLAASSRGLSAAGRCCTRPASPRSRPWLRAGCRTPQPRGPRRARDCRTTRRTGSVKPKRSSSSVPPTRTRTLCSRGRMAAPCIPSASRSSSPGASATPSSRASGSMTEAHPRHARAAGGRPPEDRERTPWPWRRRDYPQHLQPRHPGARGGSRGSSRRARLRRVGLQGVCTRA